MNGILNILKPPGMTSFDVVACMRGILRMKKIGHTGTLDPLAVGVLPVCIGSATKAIEYLVEKDKLYRAELTLGIATDTQDGSGKVLSSREVECSEDEIIDAISFFKGKYFQMPPMFSAIKVNGKKLYELAREGITIERKLREVEIYSIDIVKIDRQGQIKILFDVKCSKGTYIRTLCADIGERLGCGGHMSFLLRKKAGAFEITSSITLEELKSLVSENKLHSVLIDINTVFDELQEIKLSQLQEKRFINGVSIVLDNYDNRSTGLVRVSGESGLFLALGEISKTDSGYVLKSKKFFN